MKKKPKLSASIRLVSYTDCASVIGLPLSAVRRLVQAREYKTIFGARNQPSIAHADFVRLANDPQAIAEADLSAQFEVEIRLEDAASGKNEWYLKDIQKKLAEYRLDIDTIAKMHAKYLSRIQPTGTQTPLVAAYFLYARAINLLNMGCASLESGYWNAGLILRQIDETVHLAEYFSCCGDVPKVQQEVASWFRQNRTPEPQDIRIALTNYHSKNYGVVGDGSLLATMNELYNKKSKWVHPAFTPIREMMNTIPIENGVSIIGFDYGPCTNPKKLHELTSFYRSSVWTGVQVFALSFQRQLPLDADDAEVLLRLDQKFGGTPDGL